MLKKIIIRLLKLFNLKILPHKKFDLITNEIKFLKKQSNDFDSKIQYILNYNESVDFYTFILKNNNKSFSQNYEDLIAAYLLNKYKFQYPIEKFFVEIGAFDGITYSTTKYFEDSFNFNGIAIEASPGNYEKLKKNRKCVVLNYAVDCVSGEPKKLKEDGVYSKFVESEEESNFTKVMTKSVLEIFEEFNCPLNIDFVSIDTEGNEYEILKGIDLEKYNIKILCIETNFDIEKSKVIKTHLSKYGYQKVLNNKFDFNSWFIRV